MEGYFFQLITQNRFTSQSSPSQNAPFAFKTMHIIHFVKTRDFVSVLEGTRTGLAALLFYNGRDFVLIPEQQLLKKSRNLLIPALLYSERFSAPEGKGQPRTEAGL